MKKCIVTFFIFILPHFLPAQPVIEFQKIIAGLSDPVDLTEATDGTHQLFIVERKGKVKILKNTNLSKTLFLDVSSIITSSGQEQGLLSLAFHPQYKTNGYFFIYYTNTSGTVTVARYHRSNDSIADASSGVVLITIPKKYSNHNGGHLVFGKDGYLYFGTGDGGAGGDPDNNAQNGQSLLGKMLRIDVNNSQPPYYSIPADNRQGNTADAKPEIIATGLRNPWRWSFDKKTGDLWIGDVGQNKWEEVNMVPAMDIVNKDYGWSCIEGTHSFKNCPAKPNNVTPIFEYPHSASTGGFSITGGYVYRGTEFPALEGWYICADFVSRNGWLIKADTSGGWTVTMQKNWPEVISSFGELLDGTLYALTLSGTIYKVTAKS